MDAKKSYKVTTEFTDENGRKWKVGEKYQGNDEATQAAVAAGHIQEDASAQGQQQNR